LREAAHQLGISLLGPPFDSPLHQAEYRRVLEVMLQQGTDALVVSDAPENFNFYRLIVQLAERARLPAIYPDRMFCEVGGLMAYGSSLLELIHRLASYVDQILKGARAGEMPIYLASKFALSLNLKAAKTLGLEFPVSLFARADEVIE
jgi:putative ABC transport system substrate-binding protein